MRLVLPCSTALLPLGFAIATGRTAARSSILHRQQQAFGILAMADKPKDTKSRTEPAVEPSPPPPPPPRTLEPPEKPEPGDCCGSGCVRCVWDIYYEELETYNKSLAASDPKRE